MHTSRSTDTAAIIREAFAAVPYPGDEHIVHCEFDKRWGGSMDGPCRECAEVVELLRRVRVLRRKPEDLSYVSFALASVTDEAFAYLLPVFLIAALESPKEAGGVLESLEFRLAPDSDSADSSRISRRLAMLSVPQLEAVKSYFLSEVGHFSEVAVRRALANVESELAGRHA